MKAYQFSHNNQTKVTFSPAMLTAYILGGATGEKIIEEDIEEIKAGKHGLLVDLQREEVTNDS